MTTHHQKSAVRRAARALALAPALLVTITTGAAFADPPDTWENTPSVSGQHVILVLVLIPVALFLLIVLLVYLPSMSKGENYQPGQAWRSEPAWFGGPRGGVEALDKAEQQPALDAGESDSVPGGTSGRW